MINSKLKTYDLHGKTALVTGASSGLGERFAKILDQAGCHVVLASRRKNKMKKIASAFNNPLCVEMDVRDSDSVHSAFESIRKKHQTIDICINNAGLFKATPIDEGLDDDTFEDIFLTNVIGVWHVTKQAVKLMKEKSTSGAIINIGSINGDRVLPTHGSGYAASKAALIQLTKAWVEELSPHNIRINAISPGYVKTPPMSEKVVAEAKKITPVGFVADPKDLDGLVLYLASNALSRYVTGGHLVIDGGLSCFRSNMHS